MIRRLARTLAALLLWSAPAAAQIGTDERCWDNPNLASCLEDLSDHLVATYGARQIEAHRDAGDVVLRVSYYHNQDLLLIAFVRAPGHDPTAYIYFPRRPGRTATPPMQAPISQAAWSEAMQRAAYADRSLTPVPETDSDAQSICIHPWVYLFEASVPAERATGTRARIKRYSATSCDDAPLVPFAADFRRLALPLFPACDALDSHVYGNPVLRLRTCQYLAGDRLAAAGVMNMAHAFQTARGPEDLRDLQELFAYEAVIDWNGRRRGPEDRNPAAFWLARVAEDHVTSFTVERAEGLPDGRVRISGYLLRDRPGVNDGTYVQAHFEQVWATTWSGTDVASIAVGPWEVYRPR